MKENLEGGGEESKAANELGDLIKKNSPELYQKGWVWLSEYFAQQREKWAKNMAEYGTEVAKAEREEIETAGEEFGMRACENARQEERAKVVEEVTKKVIINSRAAIHYPEGEGVISVKDLLDILSDLQVKE